MILRDDEQTWERRELTGTTQATCERCGRPFQSAITLADATDASSQPLDGERICPDCYTRIQRDQIELNWEDAADDEP